MDIYESKLKDYMAEKEISAEHLTFNQSCHTVDEAAAAAGAQPGDFVKSICLISKAGHLIVAIVLGIDRASTTKVGNIFGIERPRQATPDEILALTGYPCGGTPAFGYPAIFLVDDHVMQKEYVYTGGGSENSLVRIAPNEILRANLGRIASIRK